MEFNQLTPKDYPALSRFFIRQDSKLCLYSLPSLIAWTSDLCRTRYAIEGDTLYICNLFPDRPHRNHLVMPVSPDRSHPPAELYALVSRLGFGSVRFIPETWVERHGLETVTQYFTISEQAEYEDYVYLTEDLATLKGKRFSKKRNLVSQFRREYMNGGGDRVAVRPMTPADDDECLAFLDLWCEERACDVDQDKDLACERDAILKSVRHIDLFGMKSLLLTIDGKAAAFAIASRLTDDMGALHFEKALSRVKGLYQYFDSECARRLFADYKYINKESDMDLPGLAKSKRSYYPVERIKSLILTPK